MYIYIKTNKLLKNKIYNTMKLSKIQIPSQSKQQLLVYMYRKINI